MTTSPPIPFIHTPPQSGVYLLRLSGVVVYVGQSVDVASRISQHFRERDKVFDTAEFHPVELGDLDAVEKAIIRRYSPRYNGNDYGTGNSRGAALALQRDVETAIGFLTHTDEDGIGARDLYERTTLRTNSGTYKVRFHTALDADPRVRYFPAEGVYRLIRSAVTEG